MLTYVEDHTLVIIWLCNGVVSNISPNQIIIIIIAVVVTLTSSKAHFWISDYNIFLNGLQVYPEGTHILAPWFERPVIYDVRARPHLVESTSGSRDLQMVILNLCACVSEWVHANLSLAFIDIHPNTASLPACSHNPLLFWWSLLFWSLRKFDFLCLSWHLAENKLKQMFSLYGTITYIPVTLQPHSFVERKGC